MGVMQRKLGRDLLANWGVLLTVIAIIAVGAASLIAMGSAQRVLETSQHAYYRDYRFADFWIDLKKAPLPAVERLAELPGVAAIQPRVVFDVILDLPGVVQPLHGRLMSTPARGFADAINGVCLVRGSGFSDDRAEEVILSEAFAKAHALDPGDHINLILNRKRESFVIVGTAISPEYIYMVGGEGDIAPDPEHFGILYIKERYAREVLDFQDACNQVAGRLVAGHDQDIERLLDRMERMLDPYGVLAATPRARQASHRFISDEIRSLAVSSIIIPGVFLGVAALVLNVLMSRLAQRQRTIIGTLKALGYTDRRVLVHFMSFGLAVGLVGGAAGATLGSVMTFGMLDIYREFFQFPRYIFRVDPGLLAIGISVSVIFAVLGTAKGVWQVLRLQPAEAMRQKPPERGGAIFLERLPGLWRRLSFRDHIALRSIARHPGRTATTIIASALSTAIVYMTLVLYDSTYFLVDFQFEHVSRSDADIGLRDETSRSALYEARRLPGVDRAEPVLSVACHLRNGWRSRRVAVTGLSDDHRLTVPQSRDLVPISIPDEGLVLARKLAEILGVQPGDVLELTPIRGQRTPVAAQVTATVDSYLGLDCYARAEYLNRLVGEAAAVSGVQLALDPARIDDLYRAVKGLPNAQGLSVRHDARRNIEKTLTETMAVTLGIAIIFAGVIAFGSMLNASMIEIGDRVREIATFRVIGYRPAQVAGIFLRQNMIVYVLGLSLAIPLGYGLTLALAQAYNTELMRMPVVVKPGTIVAATLITLAFVAVAQVLVYRAVRRLDWVEGTKAKE